MTDSGAPAGARALAEALPCVVCGRRLDNVLDDGGNQPYGGLAFETRGHYGSTIYDPGGWFEPNEFLVISVCDSCVVEASKAGRVHKGVTARQRPPTSYRPFNPEEPATENPSPPKAPAPIPQDSEAGAP